MTNVIGGFIKAIKQKRKGCIEYKREDGYGDLSKDNRERIGIRF